jgi:hypothetical protein
MPRPYNSNRKRVDPNFGCCGAAQDLLQQQPQVDMWQDRGATSSPSTLDAYSEPLPMVPRLALHTVPRSQEHSEALDTVSPLVVGGWVLPCLLPYSLCRLEQPEMSWGCGTSHQHLAIMPHAPQYLLQYEPASRCLLTGSACHALQSARTLSTPHRGDSSPYANSASGTPKSSSRLPAAPKLQNQFSNLGSGSKPAVERSSSVRRSSMSGPLPAPPLLRSTTMPIIRCVQMLQGAASLAGRSGTVQRLAGAAAECCAPLLCLVLHASYLLWQCLTPRCAVLPPQGHQGAHVSPHQRRLQAKHGRAHQQRRSRRIHSVHHSSAPRGAHLLRQQDCPHQRGLWWLHSHSQPRGSSDCREALHCRRRQRRYGRQRQQDCPQHRQQRGLQRARDLAHGRRVCTHQHGSAECSCSGAPWQPDQPQGVCCPLAVGQLSSA